MALVSVAASAQSLTFENFGKLIPQIDAVAQAVGRSVVLGEAAVLAD